MLCRVQSNVSIDLHVDLRTRSQIMTPAAIVSYSTNTPGRLDLQRLMRSTKEPKRATHDRIRDVSNGTNWYMTTRREPNPRRDDASLRVVAHRLQRVAGPTRVTNGIGVGTRGTHPSSQAVEIKNSTLQRTALRQVVLVDRDIDSLRDLAIALRGEFDFHITISGAEALALLRAGNIDAIVVGQTLYSSTGLNVLREARRHAPHTQRVLLANAAEAVAVNVDDPAVTPFRIMQRPCTADKLRDLLLVDAAAAEAAGQSERASDADVSNDALAKPNQAERLLHDPNDFEHVVLETSPELPRRTSRRNGKSVAPAGDNNVRVVVYTDNAEFYRSIAIALQDRHEVQLCTQFDRLAEMTEIGQCPILITDRAGTQVEFQRISIALRALNSNVMIIAAGPEYVGSALRRLLGTGALHSFLPTPISAPLVRLAVDSAKRQYLEAKGQRSEIPELKTAPEARQSLRSRYGAAPTPAFMPTYLNDYNIDAYGESQWRRHAPKIALAAIAAAIAVGGWFGWRAWDSSRNTNATAIPSPSPEAEIALERAAEAYAAGRYIAPSNQSAAYFYSQALQLAPENSVAKAGLDQTLTRIFERAEQALIDERIDLAADAIAAARDIQPDNNRLPFLESQLEKQRRQLEARRTAPSSTPPQTARANAVTPQTEAAVAPINNERQRQQSIARWLTTARQRLAQNRLSAPESDSAAYYFGLVERADPGNVAARQGFQEVGSRLIAQAREAMSREQLVSAKQFAGDALRYGADANEVEQLISEADAAMAKGSRARLLRLVLERTRNNQLFEPERDSARYYLVELQQMDSTSPEAQQALRALAIKLIDGADVAIGQGQQNTAAQLLIEARRIGYNGPELSAADERMRVARNPPPRAPAQSSVAAAPKAIRTVAPRFPEDAKRAGVEGWVDVAFRISAAGDVSEVDAVASDPPGPYASQFERAAVAAIRQYKFESRPIDDRQTTQRMTVRVQFKIQ